MRIFLLCLLAVGTISAETGNKTDTSKHENRRLLSRSSSSDENNEQQLPEATVGHEHSGHQQQRAGYTTGSRSAGITPGSDYTSGLSYTSGALPIGYQLYSTGNYDNLGGPTTLRQLEQGSLVSGGIQQFGQGFQAFGGSIGTSNQPIQSGVISRVAEVPVNVPRTIQVIRTAQIQPQQHPLPVEVRRPLNSSPVPLYVTKTYPINVDRPVHVPNTQPYQVPHPVPVPLSVLQPIPAPYEVPHHAVQINSGYESHDRPSALVGGQESVLNAHDTTYHDGGAPLGSSGPFNLGSQQQNFDVGSQQQNFDVGSQQQNFDVGSQQQNFDVGSQQQNFDVGSQQQHFDVGSQQQHFDVASQQQHFDVGSQQQNFDSESQQHNFDVGSQQHNFDVGSQQYNFDLVPQQHHFDLGVQQFDFGFSGISDVGSSPSTVEKVQPSLLSAVPEDQHQGYFYDKPTKKFTF